MYSGALMPASPIKPMNRPWPIHSGQGGPSVEIERPTPIIHAPKMPSRRAPIGPAIRDMMIPPAPEPSHASALASAGTERDPPTSPAMSLSATTAIQAAPNDIPRIKRATNAMVQEALLSTETGDCNIRGLKLSNPLLHTAQHFTTCIHVGSALRAALRQNSISDLILWSGAAFEKAVNTRPKLAVSKFEIAAGTAGC